MADVTVNRRFEFPGLHWIQIVNVTAASSGDTFDTKFSDIDHAFASNNTTEKGIKCTYSGGTVTITCTAGDTMDLLVIGK